VTDVTVVAWSDQQMIPCILF